MSKSNKLSEVEKTAIRFFFFWLNENFKPFDSVYYIRKCDSIFKAKEYFTLDDLINKFDSIVIF